MTIGEKIQYYRKKIGLSQEELGQKMLVSRQTISLWEMDKTLPTIENLILLKNIFAVSIDDILSEADPEDDKAVIPKETYTFQLEKKDLQKVFKKLCLPLLKRFIVFIVSCLVLFVILAAVKANNMIIGLLLGYFLMGLISYIKGYFVSKKVWSGSESKVIQSTYSYEIFDDYFVLNISDHEEITRTQKVNFKDVEKIQFFDNYLVLQFSGQNYILKKGMLNSDSAFFSFCKNVPGKAKEEKPKDALKTVSVLLLILSLCTIFGALIVTAILTGINQVMTENMWVFYLFLPIPIASIVFGYYLKKKGYKYRKNVIVGFVMATLLCIYGSFTFIFSDVYSHSEEPIKKTEQMLNIDIPTHSRINTQDWTKGTQSVPRGYVFSVSDIFFDDAAVEEFEKNLSGDTTWLTQIPNDMVGVTSYFCDIYTNCYYIIYNEDTKEFNQLPSDSGTYKFINVLYNSENNTMKLVEYQIEYKK